MYKYVGCFFCQSLSESGTALSLEESARFLSFQELSELVQALPGFLMLVSGEGKLLYLSDSVSEHLGHSMVSVSGKKHEFTLLVLSAVLLCHYFTNSAFNAMCAVWEFERSSFSPCRWIWLLRETVSTTSLSLRITSS